jgi:hypothetical protein
MKKIYVIIPLIVLVLMQLSAVKGREIELKKIEIKGIESRGTSDLNLDALGKEINNVKGGDAVDAINKVLGVASILIVSAAIIIIMIKGVSFMQAAPEGKAEIKKDMINIVIGGILIFGINGIIGIIVNIASKMF